MDSYNTIEKPSEGIYKEKGSKFISFAFPVYNENEIKEIISQKKIEFYDARHCCFAWRLGLTDDNYRTNDDGEPSGTAGKPIYGQILSNNLTNILIIVIRYFGGIKLGTSGLINAYRTATADAINNAIIVERTVNNYYTICFSYDAMNDVQKVLKDEAPQITSQVFDLQCKLSFNIRQSRSSDIISKLEKITSVKIFFDKTL